MDERKTTDRDVIRISPDLAQRIKDETGQNVYLCYQCVKCTSGCPISQFFDWQPNQIMRAVQLGQEEIALGAQTPWLCAGCQTCTTRCPQELDINAIMEFLTRESVALGYSSPVPEVAVFNEAFMREVRLWGRSYEPGVMAEVKLRTRGHLFDDLDLYVKMLKKRKVSFLPKFGRPPADVKATPGAADAVAYYPGCSLHATAAEFDTSAKAVCSELDINLVEPEGWICCGSSAAHRIDPAAATRLPMENLALIEKAGFQEVTMPCAACFNRHKAAQHEIHTNPSRRAAIDEAIDYSYQDSVQVTSLIQSILKNAGVDGISEHVRKPLTDLKVVPYYGCLLTRTPEVTEADHPENPTDMDELLAALGAEVVDWSYKTSCCGASHFLTRPDIVLDLSGDLIQQAQLAGADLIAVACPLCHANLDARQTQMHLEHSVPVLYFTQLMALAFGLPEKTAALRKNLVDPHPVLQARGIL